jgi:hypothetical protein
LVELDLKKKNKGIQVFSWGVYNEYQIELHQEHLILFIKNLEIGAWTKIDKSGYHLKNKNYVD